MSEPQLVGVYNADGGLKGELAYICGKMTGSAHCGLCDVTHGMNPFGRKDWKPVAAQLPYSFIGIHRNEQDARHRKLTDTVGLPAVLLLTDDGDRVVATPAEIDIAAKDPQVLFDHLKKAIDKA